MKDQIKAGIVGSQFGAMLHADSYRRLAHVKMQAVASPNNPDKFADEYNIPKRYKNYREMFEKEDLDMISVCVPNFLHKEIVLAAVEAGQKAIICEKPLATNLEDGRVMAEACRQNNIKFFYAEDWVFAPAIIRAKEIVDQGGIGNILYIKAKETHNGSHSLYAQNKDYCGGGAMIHLGIHPIGFLQFFTDSKFDSVMAMVSGGSDKNLLHQNYTGEDWSAALVTMKNGVRAFIEGNYITCGGMDDRVEIYGSEGNIQIDLTTGSPLRVYSRPGYEYAIEKTDFTHGWTKPAVDEFFNLGYVNEITHFVDCVMNETTIKPGVTLEDGLHAMEVVFAIYESTSTGKLIKL